MGNLIVRGRRHSSLVLLLLGLTTVIFVACGGSEDSPDPTATAILAAPTATTAAAAEPTATAEEPEPTAMADDPDPTATIPPPTSTVAPELVPTTAMTPDDDDPGLSAAVDVYSGDEMGDILVGSNGLTLYIFDRDTEGVSNCSGGCLNAWPPVYR